MLTITLSAFQVILAAIIVVCILIVLATILIDEYTGLTVRTSPAKWSGRVLVITILLLIGSLFN